MFFWLLDMLLEDSGDGGSWKEGQHVKVVVSLEKDPEWKEVWLETFQQKNITFIQFVLPNFFFVSDRSVDLLSFC